MIEGWKLWMIWEGWWVGGWVRWAGLIGELDEKGEGGRVGYLLLKGKD